MADTDIGFPDPLALSGASMQPYDEVRRKEQQAQPIPKFAQGAIHGILGVDASGLWRPNTSDLDVDAAGAISGREDPFARVSVGPVEQKEAPARSDAEFGGPPTGEPTPARTARIDAAPPASYDRGPSGDIGSLGRPLYNDTRSLPESGQGAASPPAMQPNGRGVTLSSQLGIPEGSLVDRLLNNLGNFRDANKLTLLALAGGLAGSQSWGQGLGRGFTAALPAQMADIRQNQQNQTLRALGSMGYNPDLAQAIASNPATLQQVLASRLGVNNFELKTVKDITGAERLVRFDPKSGTLTNPDGTLYASGFQSPGEIPSEIRNELEAIYQGRQPSTGRNVQNLLPLVNQLHPDFDAKDYPAMLGVRKSYTSGRDFQEVQALNTVQGHMARLADSADALGNTSFKPWNGLRNFVLDQTVGSPELVRFRNDLVTTQNELARAYHGGHVSDSAYAAFNKAINEAQTPAEMRAAIGEISGLLDSKLEAKESGYRSGMHGAPLPDEYRTENEHARLAHRHVANYAAGEKQPRFEAGERAAPQAQQAQVPPPEQRQVGRIYPTPKGMARWMGNGWQLVQ